MTKTNFKRKKISVTSVILIVLATVLVVGGVGYLSKGYQDMNVKGWIYERNPDNLLDYEFGVEYTNNGVRTTVDDYGVITIKGYLADTGKKSEYNYVLGTIELPVGTYVLSTVEGLSSKNTVSLVANYKDADGSTKFWYADNTTEMVKTFDTATVVEFQVQVYKDDCDVNYTVHPVLNEGEKPLEDFLVTRSSAKK